MSNTNADMETKGHQAQVEDVYDSDEKTRYADMKADAIEAENAEHRLGVLEAVRTYPMAATWAFVVSCTIVCYRNPSDYESFQQKWLLTMYPDHGVLLRFPHGQLHCLARVCR